MQTRLSTLEHKLAGLKPDDNPDTPLPDSPHDPPPPSMIEASSNNTAGQSYAWVGFCGGSCRRDMHTRGYWWANPYSKPASWSANCKPPWLTATGKYQWMVLCTLPR